METSLVHCLWHCYSCYALVNNTGNELVIFPGIALKTDNKTIITTKRESYEAAFSGIQMSRRAGNQESNGVSW